MRGRIVFLMFGLILICLVFSMMPSIANSEIFFDLKPPRNPGKGTEEGSALVLHSFSKLFVIFEELEQGNIPEANKLLAEVCAALSKAVPMYKDFASGIPSTLTGTANLPNEKIKMIKKDFRIYKLEIPKTYSDLAYFAYKEVNNFAEFMNTVNFNDDPARNRQTVREIVDRLYRYMRLGISVAEIAASWSMKQP